MQGNWCCVPIPFLTYEHNAGVCIHHVSAMHLLLYMYGCTTVALLCNQAACCVTRVSVQNIYMSSACWWDTLMLTLLIGRVYMLSTCAVAVLGILAGISPLSWSHLSIAHFSHNLFFKCLKLTPVQMCEWLCTDIIFVQTVCTHCRHMRTHTRVPSLALLLPATIRLSGPQSQDTWATNYLGGCAPEETPPPHTHDCTSSRAN